MESRTRRIAGASLFIMGAGFAAALPFQSHTAGKLLAGAFEAGLVGGLADWFAVTALFRHPMGIPIPHTALLPRNRDKLTNALVSMVQNNLLNKESIVGKLKEFQAVERIMDVVEKALRSPEFRLRVQALARDGLSKPLDGLWERLRPSVLTYVRSRNWADTLLAAAANKDQMDRVMEQLLDYALRKGAQWLVTVEARKQLGAMAMKAIGGLQMNGLMQFAVNAALNYFTEDQIGGAIQQALVIKLREAGLEGHPTREAILSYMSKEWSRLLENEDTRANWNRQLQNMLGNVVEGEQPLQLLGRLQKSLLDKLESGELLDGRVLPLLEQGLARLRRDPELIASLNSSLQNMTVRMLEANHSRIGSLVRENIEKMNNQDLIDLVEDKAGKDLQWIRVNGAVCGFFLGLIFTTVRMLI